MAKHFFVNPKDHSLVKSEIVVRYFTTWACILSRKTSKLAYADLFAGPGRYNDGTESTPLKVLRKIMEDTRCGLPDIVATYFNEGKQEYFNDLVANVSAIDQSMVLRHSPVLQNKDAREVLLEWTTRLKDTPTLYFVDPFGFAGISTQALARTLACWGSELILFFHYDSINRWIHHPFLESTYGELFPDGSLEDLKARIDKLSTEEREAELLNAFCRQMVRQHGQPQHTNKELFYLPFRFIREGSSRTSHYLLFFTKNKLGYEKMKTLMFQESEDLFSLNDQFCYLPKSRQQDFLKGFNRTTDELERSLVADFAGREMPWEKLHLEHPLFFASNFTAQDYRLALIRLKDSGAISAYRPSKTPIKVGQLPKKSIVVFPTKD